MFIETEEEVLKSKRVCVHKIDLFLQFEGEDHQETVRNYPAILYDILESQENPPEEEREARASRLRLRLKELIEFLQVQGFSFEKLGVSYFSNLFSTFINCSNDLDLKNVWLSLDDLEEILGRPSLRLKF